VIDRVRRLLGKYGSVWFLLPTAAFVLAIVVAVFAFTGGGGKQKEPIYLIHGVAVTEEGVHVLRTVERRHLRVTSVRLVSRGANPPLSPRTYRVRTANGPTLLCRYGGLLGAKTRCVRAAAAGGIPR
jgi:hypothetical protein